MAVAVGGLIASETLSSVGLSDPLLVESIGMIGSNGLLSLEDSATLRTDVALCAEDLATWSLNTPTRSENVAVIRADVAVQTEDGLAFLITANGALRLESLLTISSPPVKLVVEVLSTVAGTEPFYIEVPFATVDGRRVITRLDLVLDVPQDVYVIGPDGPFLFIPPGDVTSEPDTIIPQSSVRWTGTGVASPGGFPEADVAKVWVQLNPNGQSWRFVPHNLGSGVAIASNEGVLGSLPYTVWPRSKLPLLFTQDQQNIVESP